MRGGWQNQRLELMITVPDGFGPTNFGKAHFDPDSDTLRVPVNSPVGTITWRVDGDVEGPFLIVAALLANGEIVARNNLTLKEQFFDVGKEGGEVKALQGRVSVTFPAGAASEGLKVRIRPPRRSVRPPHLPGGHPFEILAEGQDSRTEVRQFHAPLTIRVNYPEEAVRGDESSLAVFFYDEQTGVWLPMPTDVDPESNLLIAETDHLTLFDFNAQDWQSAHLPSVDSFQVAPFTGAATYTFPIKLPPGPGGLEPRLILRYNSQVVDGASNRTQASWAGMGWSLDTGFIQRDMNGTSDYEGDDTYTLNIDGSSHLLLPVPDDPDNDPNTADYRTADESFRRIRHYAAKRHNGYWEDVSYWRVWDKTGATYIFNPGAYYPDFKTCGVDMLRRWQWPLARVINKFGQELSYEYAHEFKPTEGTCGYRSYHTTAAYPSVITYPHNRYRVVFERTGRQDYVSQWEDWLSFRVLFKRSLLSEIRVEHDADGDEYFEQIIRKYVFTYESDPTKHIFPNVVWPKGGRTPTLIEVEEFGLNGSESLPPTRFIYGDGMHLTRAENGYGGSIEFSYEAWHDLAGVEDPEQAYYIPKAFVGEFSIDNLDMEVYYPGSAYKLSASTWSGEGQWVQFGFDAGAGGTVYSEHVGFDPQYTWYNPEAFVVLPATASKALPLFNTSYAAFNNYYLTLLPTRYRVLEKRVYDSDDDPSPDVFAYTYDGPATNDTDHSEKAGSDRPYVKAHSEFRGHAMVQEIGPDGRFSTTWFHQDDAKKGRPYKSQISDGETNVLIETETIYLSDKQPVGNLPAKKGKQPYTDLAVYWTRVIEKLNRTYKNNGSWVGTQTRYTYDDIVTGVPQYGNVVAVIESELDGSKYRSTHLRYFPTDTVSTYLVGLPAYEERRDATGVLLAASQYLYDDHTSYTAPPSVGILTGKRILVDAGSYADESYVYDAWGNRIIVIRYTGYSTADVPAAEGPQFTTTVYDSTYHTYPIAGRNHLKHETRWDYNWTLGKPIQKTDPNGAVTAADYDGFGRLIEIRQPGDESGPATMAVTYEETTFPFLVEVHQRRNAETVFTQRRFYDGIGRMIQAQSAGVELDEGVRDVIVDYRHDAYGRVVQQTVPYVQGPGGKPSTRTDYDVLGRPRMVKAPDQTVSIYTYDGLETTVTDTAGRSTATSRDLWGRAVRVTPPLGPEVTYAYDELDRLLQVQKGTGASATFTSLEYDLAGRKIWMNDADMGAWSYDYDAVANLLTQTDARNCTTTLGYDPLNRLISKTYDGPGVCASTAPVTYIYDKGSRSGILDDKRRYFRAPDPDQPTIGRRTQMRDGSGLTAWQYDTRGRLVAETKKIVGVGTFFTEWAYDSADRVTQMHYPGGSAGQTGEKVVYDYYTQGALKRLIGDSEYVHNLAYDATGRIVSRVLGPQLMETSFEYYDWTVMGGRLALLATKRLVDAAILQELEYGYDLVGNVDWINDLVAGLPQQQDFAYDDLNRLLSATVTGGQDGLYDDDYTYNPVTGNLASKAGVNYFYDDASHPHAVTELGSGWFYSYDANGNLITRQGDSENATLTYDAENRLVEVMGNAWAQFVYDGDGNRVLATVDGVTTVYAGDHYEIELETGTVRKYYSAGGVRVAMKQGDILYYLLPDHLGSTALTVDEFGNKAAELRYKAWGEARYSEGTTPTTFRYTGQRQEESLGLYYYRARWYDPALGRFIQADTIVPEPGNPQALDRYAYVHNNPLKFVDPTGHMVEAGPGGGGGGCAPGENCIITLKAGVTAVHRRFGDEPSYNYGPEPDAGYSVPSYGLTEIDFLNEWMRPWANVMHAKYIQSQGPNVEVFVSIMYSENGVRIQGIDIFNRSEGEITLLGASNQVQIDEIPWYVRMGRAESYGARQVIKPGEVLRLPKDGPWYENHEARKCEMAPVIPQNTVSVLQVTLYSPTVIHDLYFRVPGAYSSEGLQVYTQSRSIFK
jgi:RHS repeat-associated protein